MQKIILASSSKYRKELLLRLGLEFECISPDVDEDKYKDEIPDPIILAKVLGEKKAEAIAKDYPDAIIIGSDQLAHLDGTILGKTGNLENAVDQLMFLKGKTHELITSFTIIRGKEKLTYTDITKLTMKKLTKLQINNYLRHDNPFDCAGSYKLELRGISLFSRIVSEDHTAIIGLPLIALGEMLEKFGVQVPPELT